MLRETFSTYGLNRQRNFLQGGYVYLNDTEELANWMANEINEHSCIASAIFAIGIDLKMYVGMTELNEDDEIEISIMAYDWNMDLFSVLDGNERLCCYGLIEEISPGIWKIMEE